MSTDPGLSRRRLLALGPAAAAVSALAACTGDADPPLPSASPSPRPTVLPVDPDLALRDAAAARERALLARYDAALAARPGLSARLLPLRGHHAEHLAALRDPSASPSPTGTPPASPDAVAPPAVPPPADDAAALAALTAAEREAGQAHGRDCLAASRPLAAVLGSLSASELSHAVALA